MLHLRAFFFGLAGPPSHWFHCLTSWSFRMPCQISNKVIVNFCSHFLSFPIFVSIKNWWFEMIPSVICSYKEMTISPLQSIYNQIKYFTQQLVILKEMSRLLSLLISNTWIKWLLTIICKCSFWTGLASNIVVGSINPQKSKIP